MFNHRLFKKLKQFSYWPEFIVSLIIIYAGYLTISPHLSYQFPFHVDEWYHIATAKMIATGSSVNWYYGEPFQFSLESGWHAGLSLFQQIFHPDISIWMIIPPIIHIISIITTYFFISRLFTKNEGVISALLVALLPTNVTIGGPVFLIPVNLSLLFIPLGLLCAFNLLKIEKRFQYVLLFIVITFLLYAHPPSAMVLLFFLGFYSLLLLTSKKKEDRKHSSFLILTTGMSIVAALPNYLVEIQSQGLGSITFQFWIYLKEIPFLFGFIQIIFFIIGFTVLSRSKDKKIWSILLTTLFLIVNIVLFTQLNINYLLPYQRTYIPLFLLMIFITSYGYTRINVIKPRYPRYKTLLSVILVLALCATIFEVSTKQNQFYEVIDQKDYENFQFIKSITTSEDIIICDPWKARALPAVSERIVYAVIPFGPTEQYINLVNNATTFFENNCRNTTFLLTNNITYVYARGYDCYNPDLEIVKQDIYRLKTI